MKKAIMAPAIMLLLVFISTTHAATATWVDYWEAESPVFLSADPFAEGAVRQFTYVHDLTDDNQSGASFVVGQDTITDLDLLIGFYDDEYDPGRIRNMEMALVSLSGAIFPFLSLDASEPYEITIDGDNPWRLNVINDINEAGALTVTIRVLLGDFYLSDSTLTAQGTSTVPIPCTLFLLGAGLLGLLKLRKAAHG